jgi:hypothetical protein
LINISTKLIIKKTPLKNWKFQIQLRVEATLIHSA